MRRGVERSQSLRGEIPKRTDTPVASYLRPKVSFNRDVHIKRISRRLADVLEDEDSPDTDTNKMAANGLSNVKYSTLPTRGLKKSQPSERLSRLISTDPKADETSVREERFIPIKLENQSRETNQKTEVKKKKKTFSERMKGFFTPKKNEKKDETDVVKTRYSEFKGKNSSSDATDNELGTYRRQTRRGSAPESRSSWIRNERRKGNDSTTSGGESEFEGMGQRAPSLVYLHSPAVGDIPNRPATPAKRLSRSVSVLAPWAPTKYKTKPPLSNTPKKSRSTQTESISRINVTSLPPRSPLPKLVFTGPSLEETLGKNVHRNNGTLRGRK